jgi:hypothetical protein
VQSVPVNLRLAGHRVFVAGCGLDAIKKARNLLPDLVVVDATLPDMDGPDVIDMLRCLPSTGSLPTMLFKGRPGTGPGGMPEGGLEPGAPASTELLERVALALLREETEAGHLAAQAREMGVV